MFFCVWGRVKIPNVWEFGAFRLGEILVAIGSLETKTKGYSENGCNFRGCY